MNKFLSSLAAIEITNPCEQGYVGVDECPGSNTQAFDVFSLLNDIITWLTIAIGIAAILFIIISGIQLSTSSGDSDKVKRAKRTLLYSVIGLIVAILANVIVNLTFSASDIFTPNQPEVVEVEE
ncbi:pilin [Ruminococcaceae bacterium OttesenSCG-928-A11]|nr:pilin [Ruminococcaceae bacterium OttesenSCG-928-A11]